MARIRNIKPELTLDEELAELGFAARFFFINLWCHCDREGRCQDRPKMLQALILPWDDNIDADQLLHELHPHFVIRYEVDGRRYLQVRNFLKHQRPKPEEQESIIPPAPEKYLLGLPKVSLGTPKGVMEGEREGEGEGERGVKIAPSPAGSPPPSLALLTYPCISEPKTWDLTEAKLAEYVATYAAVDVRAECRKAWQWCQDNAANRKTARGMPAFLSRWLSKEQDRGRYRPTGQEQASGTAKIVRVNRETGEVREV